MGLGLKIQTGFLLQNTWGGDIVLGGRDVVVEMDCSFGVFGA